MRHHVHRGRGASHPAQNGTVPRRKVVLVLEDNGSVGGLVAGLVRQEGYRAVRAWDTAEALRLARGRRPDAVVLDLNLAYEEGLLVLNELRGNEATRRTPIVLVAGSGLNVSSDEREMVADVVVKPFDIDVMLNAVRRALGDPEVEVEPRQYDAQDHFLHGY